MERTVDQKVRRSADPLTPNEIEEVIGDPSWFPLEFDVGREEFRFALVPPETLREVAFIRSLKWDGREVRSVPLAVVRDAAIPPSRLHVILHSSLGGSTLLTRALGRPGVGTPLQEPPILTDVIAYGLQKPGSQMMGLLDDVTRLLSRPHGDEVPVCKVSGIGNGLSIPMAEMHPGSRILCLDTPLEEMLSSYAARGAEGRQAARKLLIGIKNSHMLAVALPEEKYPEFIDLQFAALSWLSMRKMMLEAATKLGGERVRTLTSEQLLQAPREALAAAAEHFGLGLNVEECFASGIFDRHAKTGEPFNPEQRAERTAERLRVHRDEIEPVVEWTRKVAESTAIDWDLPYPLLS